MRLRVCVIAVAVLVWISSGLGQVGVAGSNGLAFLKIGVGARASGMSGAYVAVADEATATYWNPAGLAFMQNTQVTFTHAEWVQDISNEFLAVAFPVFRGVLGLSLYSNNVGGIEYRVKPSEEPLGVVEAHDLAVGLSYGRTFGDRLTAGVTVKYLYEKIFVASASGFAADLGITVRPLNARLRLAAVLQNVGSMDEFLEESIELPTTTRVGAAYAVNFENMGLILAADAVHVRGGDLQGHFGVELILKEYLHVRTGYDTGTSSRGIGGGFGVQVSRYQLHYGFTPFDNNLGDTHRFSVAVNL